MNVIQHSNGQDNINVNEISASLTSASSAPVTRTKKKFSPGQIVIHRQLQVSTGSGGALKPLFTGPYIVNSIDKDRSSASLEHLHTGREISAHFTNIQIFHFDPSQNRLPHLPKWFVEIPYQLT